MVMASSNGCVPPGFRFHPTDEELLHYYLQKKVSFQKFDMEVIREIDLNKLEPWQLRERCRIGSTPQNEWYFFSHKDRKYPTGSRTNRATNAGFWKATGRDKCIRNSYKKIGMRKTLVFYRGRAPHVQKYDWIMHEYRLEDGDDQGSSSVIVCRVFKKKILFKLGNGGGTSINTSEQQINSCTTQPHNFIHKDTRSLFNQNHTRGTHQPFEVNSKPELDLLYPHMTSQYSQLQSQALMPTHNKSLGYDYSTLSSETPVMVKQLMSNARDCESGCGSLRYQATCEPALEVTTCEPSQVLTGRDHEGLIEWAMLDRIVTSHMGNEDSSKRVRYEDANGSSVHPVNHLRGEMDFWGYGK
ncbi:hypothetical protein K2173_018645 [Erythroxylum novogranatense]|uniref:NAC domain-containing protein n=1 Tax=Erythroxylum novogranatense TaxID=1862640 RepID=A0AAV8SAV2_9ROSI|nr:hypothetical protein K2173_018645 [Erythroxylum novogranatense]